MAFGSGGGVAEGFGDDGHRCEFGELVEGTESCGRVLNSLLRPNGCFASASA